MKFECEKTLLASAIDGVSRAITNRAAIPVLEGIYMKAEGFNLTLTGYDMEMGITTTIECNVLVPGETVLDAKLLSAMVNRMPAGDVCIELNDEGQAKISGGVAEFEIPALNASDYPSLPVTGADNTMTVKCGMLREMIEKTIYAVSQDDKKPAHTGELFVIEPGSLTIVALDGYRLAIIQRDVECTRDIRIIIPAKTLQELLKIMGGADDDVKIDANRRYVVFTSNGYTIMSRLIEGDFLNYESVIPKDRKTRVTVECKNFIDTIERASLIITERLKNPLRISFAEDRVTVRCQTPLGKVVDEFAPVSMEGDAVEIGFNNRYLLDALRFSKCEKMVLGEADASGRRSPVGSGEFFTVPCDLVISAVGEQVDSALMAANGIEVDKKGRPAFQTNLPGVYAAGDAARGPATVVEGIADAQYFANAVIGEAHKFAIPAKAVATREEAVAKKGVLCESAKCEGDRCLTCNVVCQVCADVCPNRANVVIELPDGRIVTGKTSGLMGASCAALLNAIKLSAGIDDRVNLISPMVLAPIQHLKIEHLGNSNPRLHTDEVLIALSISAVTNPTAELAMEALASLRGSQVHSSVILSSVDEGMFKRLGMNVTFEPVYQSHTLYHK